MDIEKHPPGRSKGILTDIRYFFLNKPGIATRIQLKSEEERNFYTKSILQRTGIAVDNYNLLNLHHIGIEAPSSYVFNELLKWNGDSSCWPNHVAKVELQDDHLEEIHIYLFGFSKRFFGISPFHLFQLKSIKIQKVPALFDFDNARYLMYSCSGGYPIGVFCMYVRTSIPERGEKEMSQLFMLTGFNFYGKKALSRLNIINKVWESIHNRVTTNVVNRFKELCEWRFEQFVKKESI